MSLRVGLLPGFATPGYHENRVHGIDVLNVGSAVYVVPEGVYRLTVTVVGGGGGAGSATTINTTATAGGAGGGLARKTITVRPGDRIPYTVGAGGAGNNDANGGPGGASSFGDVSATGGAGGQRITASSAQAGIGIGGDLNIRGDAGGPPSSTAFAGGDGGGSPLSGRTQTQNVGSIFSGAAGNFPGGGAQGCCGNAGVGSGANGTIIVEY